MENFVISQQDALEQDRYRQRKARRRTQRFQCILGSVLVLLLSTCGALVVFILYSQGKIPIAGRSHTSTEELNSDALQDEWCENSCMTPQCVEAAAYMLERMDLSANPCDDFYQFTCGKFIANRFPPDDHYQESIFQILENEILIVLKKMLESPHKTNSEAAVKAKHFYATCLNTSNMEDPVTILRDIFTDYHMGEWPLLEDHWDDTTFDFEQRIAIVSLMDSSVFFSTNFYLRNETTLVFNLYKKRPFLKHNVYTSNETEDVRQMEQYKKVLDEIFRILGVPESRREAEINSIIDFEIQYSLSYQEEEEKENDTSEPEYDWSSSEQQTFRSPDGPIPKVMLEESNEDKSDNETESPSEFSRGGRNEITLQDLQERTPNVNWSKILNIALEHYGMNLNDYIFKIMVPSFDTYIEKISKLVKETPPRILANYMSLQLVLNNLRYMSKSLRRIFWENDLVFPKDYQVRQFHSEWKNCASMIRKEFPFVATSLYLQNAPKKELLEETKKKFSEMTSLIIRKLERHNISEEIKGSLIHKVKSMEITVGFPQVVLDSKKVDEMYKKLQLSENFLKNKLAVKILDRMTILAFTVTDKSEERVIPDPLEVNAFYSNIINVIAMPLGLLRHPEKFLGLSQYLTYGSLGIIMGHEIMHGLATYDPSNGTFEHPMEFELPGEFHTHRMCLADQYSKYPIEKTTSNVNGNWTLNENYADNGALNHAFGIYTEYINKYGEESNLPGIRFNNKQMFFIVYGQLWCEVLNEKGYRKYLKDNHSPGRYRVILPVSNSKEFAETFNCPMGSPMNPVQKCIPSL